MPDWTGIGYRLPTEAEWEYACRAGSQTRFSFGDDARDLVRHAWFGEAVEKRAHPVAGKLPNAWGLFDMYGNVGEWCWDWYDQTYYNLSPRIDPKGAAKGEHRVYRGGGVESGRSRRTDSERIRVRTAARSPKFELTAHDTRRTRVPWSQGTQSRNGAWEERRRESGSKRVSSPTDRAGWPTRCGPGP